MNIIDRVEDHLLSWINEAETELCVVRHRDFDRTPAVDEKLRTEGWYAIALEEIGDSLVERYAKLQKR